MRTVEPDGTQTYFIGRCPHAVEGPNPNTARRCPTSARVLGEWKWGEAGMYVRWHNPDSDKSDRHGYLEGPVPPEHAQRWGEVPHCIAHRAPLVFARIRGVRTGTACEAICQRSTAKECRCSCGGANHGVSA